MPSSSYVRRLPDQHLADLFQDVPAIMISGPRAAGKTTTARQLASQVLHLDDPGTAAVVAADPDAALRGAKGSLLIDEWQEVPSILGAIKRAVDADYSPGRFVLTGSVEAEMSAAMWPGTGRVIRTVLHGLTQRELRGNLDSPWFIDRMLQPDLAEVPTLTPAWDLLDYLQAISQSGFPEPALRLPAARRSQWLTSYLEHVVARDVEAYPGVRDPLQARAYLEAFALSTAGLPTDDTLSQAAGINRRTAERYDRLYSALFLVELVPAWATNRLTRLMKRPKRYVVDSALALAAARVEPEVLLQDPDLLGRLMDTFVAAQLRPELELRQPRARLHHLRTESGRQEVDLVIDLGQGRVIALEVKAGSAPSLRDARHLIWMRDRLGDSFVRGVVLHTGRMPFELEDRIWAVPISSIWA